VEHRRPAFNDLWPDLTNLCSTYECLYRT
jgi:hypothetical protein